MICALCQEGDLKKIQFKPSNQQGYICSMCESVWLEGEDTTLPGHPLQSFSPENGYEYYIELTPTSEKILDGE